MPNMTEEELAERLATNPDLSMVIGADGVTTVALDAGKRKSPEADFERESETDFLSWCIDYAHVRRWRCAHFRPARVIKNGKETWRTAGSADAKGYPDLCLVRDNRLIFAEIKSATGKVSKEQYDWLEALGKAVPVYIFRPSDRPQIERILE